MTRFVILGMNFPCIYTGMSYGIILRESFDLIRIPNSPRFEEESIPLPIDSKYDLGLSAGLGIQLSKQFSLDLNYYTHLFLVLSNNFRTLQFRAAPIILSVGYLL